MGFATIRLGCWGIGPIGLGAIAEDRPIMAFTDYDGGVPPDESTDELGFGSWTGEGFGAIPGDVQNSPFKRTKFTVDPTGSKDFEFELTRDSGLPLGNRTTVELSVGGYKTYRGFIGKWPGVENANDRTLKYSGGGANSILKGEITLKQNRQIYQITSITVLSGMSTLHLNQAIHVSMIDAQIVRVYETAEDINSGRFDVFLISGSTIQVQNPGGLAQTFSEGYIELLPRAWTEPTGLISDVLKSIVDEWITDLPVSGSTAKIQDTTGIYVGAGMDFSGVSLKDAFDVFRKMMPEWDLYFDTDGLLVYQPKDETIQAVLIEGYDFQENEIKENGRANYIEVTSKKESGTGYSVPAIAKNDTSILVNSRMEYIVELPGYYSDELKQRAADQLLAAMDKEFIEIKLKKLPFRYYRRGIYRAIMQPRQIDVSLDECDTTTGWSGSPTVTTTELQTGAGSLKFTLSGTGTICGKDYDRSVTAMKKFTLNIKGNRSGMDLTLKIIYGSVTSSTRVYFPSAGWRRVQWSVDGIESIDRVEIYATNYVTGDYIVVDSILVNEFTSIHRDLELVEVTYNREPDKKWCDLTIGTRSPRISSFLAAIMQKHNSMKVALKE